MVFPRKHGVPNKVHIFRPRSYATPFDSDVVRMNDVNECCFPYDAELLRDIVVSIRRIRSVHLAFISGPNPST
jgi:hypothetical protein